MRKKQFLIYFVLPLVLVIFVQILNGPSFLYTSKPPTSFRGLASVELFEAFQVEEGSLRELDITRNRAFKVPTLQMYPNYFLGDILTVSIDPNRVCLNCIGGIEIGEVVAFKSPKDGLTIGFGRVLGLPGDIIKMEKKELSVNGKKEVLIHLANGNTKVNDVKFDYSKSIVKGIVYVIVQDPKKSSEFNGISITVPKNNLFIIGDNRDYSVDSRSLGPIPVENIVGVEIGMTNETRTEKTLFRLRPKD
jgi:signal peptidase I